MKYLIGLLILSAVYLFIRLLARNVIRNAQNGGYDG